MPDPEQIRKNLAALRAQGAPEEVIDRYMASVGGKPVDDTAPAPEAAKPANDYGPYEAAANGLLGGFAGEAAAGLRSHAPAWMLGPEARGKTGTYDQELAKEEEGAKQYREQHPMANVAAESVGMAPVAALTGGMGLGVKNVLARAALTQGALGAVYGAGNAGEGNRVRGAVAGGALGGAVGAGTQLGLKALQAAAEVMPGINTVGQKLRMLPKPQQKADQLITQRLAQDELTPAQVAADVAARPDTKPEVLLDVGGENTASLGKLAVNTPGKGRKQFADFVEQRQADAPQRIAETMETSGGMTPVNRQQTADALIAAQRQNAKPLYDAALKGNPVDDDAINAFIQTPEGRAAFDIAKSIRRKDAEAEALRLGKAVTPKDYALPEVFDLQSGELTAVPDDRTLHYMKLALDDMSKYGYVPPGGSASTRNFVSKGVSQGFRQHIGTLIPGYDQAAGQFASDQQAKEAFEAGTNFLKEDAQKSAGDVAQMSPGDKTLYRYGQGTAIRRTTSVAPDGSDVAKRVFGSPEKRAQIAAGVDNPAAFADIEKEMAREKAMAATNKLQGGSHTAFVQNEGMDASRALNALGRLGRGNIAGALGSLAVRGWNGITPEVNDALTTRMLAGRGGRQELLSALDAIQRSTLPQFQKSAAMSSLVAAMSGSMAGLSVR